MNSVNLTGRITKDPEIRYSANGTSNVMFNIAVDRGFKDQNGNKQADFIACVAWRNQADFIAKYVQKGNLLEITGALQTRQYQTQSGENRVITEVIVNQVANLTPRDTTQAPIPPKPQQKPKEPVYEETSESFPVDSDLEGLPWL